MEIDKIINIDVLEGLKSLPDNSIDLIVTSPPYNKGFYNKHKKWSKWDMCHTKSRVIDYGVFDDCMPPEEYEQWQRDVLTECCRVVKPTGSIFYNHKDIPYELNCVHPKWVYDFPLKQVIVWDRNSTLSIGKPYFYPVTEYVFWLKKDYKSRPYFNRGGGDYEQERMAARRRQDRKQPPSPVSDRTP